MTLLQVTMRDHQNAEAGGFLLEQTEKANNIHNINSRVVYMCIIIVCMHSIFLLYLDDVMYAV